MAYVWQWKGKKKIILKTHSSSSGSKNRHGRVRFGQGVFYLSGFLPYSLIGWTVILQRQSTSDLLKECAAFYKKGNKPRKDKDSGLHPQALVLKVNLVQACFQKNIR